MCCGAAAACKTCELQAQSYERLTFLETSHLPSHFSKGDFSGAQCREGESPSPEGPSPSITLIFSEFIIFALRALCLPPQQFLGPSPSLFLLPKLGEGSEGQMLLMVGSGAYLAVVYALKFCHRGFFLCVTLCYQEFQPPQCKHFEIAGGRSNSSFNCSRPFTSQQLSFTFMSF